MFSKYSYKKLLKSDNPFSSYNRKCSRCFDWKILFIEVTYFMHLLALIAFKYGCWTFASYKWLLSFACGPWHPFQVWEMLVYSRSLFDCCTNFQQSSIVSFDVAFGNKLAESQTCRLRTDHNRYSRWKFVHMSRIKSCWRGILIIENAIRICLNTRTIAWKINMKNTSKMFTVIKNID